MTPLDDNTVWRFRYQPAYGFIASAALHAAVAAAMLPQVFAAETRLTDRMFEVTLELPSAPTEEQAASAAPVAALRQASGSVSESDAQAAPEADQRVAAVAASPVPRDPGLMLVVPSAEPPPIVTQGEIGAGRSVAVTPPDLEKMLPAVSAPPLVTGRDFALATPPAQPRAPTLQARPQATAPPQPIRQAVPNRASQQQAADGHGALDDRQRQARQDYLMQVIRKLSQYRFYEQAREASTQGTVVARLTVARDGQLLDLSLARSSGFPGRDRSVTDTIRRAAPFAPLPADIGQEPYTFVVPVGYALEQ
jgi:periplasmic protein TonB